jgi:hypothetical protein
MKAFSFSQLARTAALSAITLTGSFATSLAYDGIDAGTGSSTAGVIRISNQAPGANGKEINAQPVGFGRHHHGYTASGNCPSDNCPTGHCQGGRCQGCLFGEKYCKNSPDAGYSVPAKYPVLRRGVQYTQYYPNTPYGTSGHSPFGGSFPVVYQPTDTTQLGYTYQHVPFWMPNPSKLPERPDPQAWHIKAPYVQASQLHGGGSYGYNAYHGGLFGHHHHGHHGHHATGDCPYCQQGSTTYETAPSAAPVGSPAISPSPATAPLPSTAPPPPETPPTPRLLNDSAESGHIRRAGF